MLLGVLHALSFRADIAWPLEEVALAALFGSALRAPGPGAAAQRGFAFGLGWFLTGVYWVFISIHTYGQVDVVLAALATLLFSSVLAVFPAGALALARWAAPPGRSGLMLALLPWTWTLAEFARASLFTGFPWLATGYAHIGSPLAGFAPFLGVMGVTLAAALVAAALLAFARPLEITAARGAHVAIGLFLIGVLGAGSLAARIEWASPTGRPLTVRLLQGNIPQDIKFDPAHFQSTLTTYLNLIEARPADLIVLPETAFPAFLDDLPSGLMARIVADSERLHAAIAFGVPIADSATVYTNSVIAVDPSRPGLQRYDKEHLVPFGEFVPIGFHWFVRMMNIPLGDFTPGRTDAQPLTLAGERVAFNICYEDVFGAEIRRQAAAANLLVNVSNVAWFGDSQALPQHLQSSRMRALETAHPMLRATNTGMTAAIDPHGRVTAVLPPFTTAALEVSVQPVTAVTPYVRFGDTPTLLVTGLIVVAAAVRRARAG